MRDDILLIVKELENLGYESVQLPELKFHYKKRFNANVDEQQLAKALRIAGYKIIDDTVRLSVQTVSHFHKQHRPKNKELLRS